MTDLKCPCCGEPISVDIELIGEGNTVRFTGVSARHKPEEF